ncbi:MAG: N-acetylmuramoyl-L-alanine amidase [Acidimicrobiales bacterium]
MGTRLRVLVGVGLVAAAGAALAAGARALPDDTDSSTATTTSSTTSTSTSTTTASTTTTTLPPSTTTTAAPPWPALAGGAPRAVTTSTGVVLAVLRANADGTFLARTPCGGEATVRGAPITGAHVVLDPGHGGDEPGAVGPAGSQEKAVNLAVAQETKRQLEALGATVVLTRTGDYRITLASRAAIATNVHPVVFVSIHHNAEPDEERPTPGAETYFQIASPESKRAAGLVYQEVYGAFEPYGIRWGADRDAGAKYRPASDGGDYYGILRRTAGVPAVLSEAAFITNPAEEALLVDPAFQRVEAAAITRAIVRFATTRDQGSGYVTPYPRTQPAGPGGGSQGCTDPPLG